MMLVNSSFQQSSLLPITWLPASRGPGVLRDGGSDDEFFSFFGTTAILQLLDPFSSCAQELFFSFRPPLLAFLSVSESSHSRAFSEFRETFFCAQAQAISNPSLLPEERVALILSILFPSLINFVSAVSFPHQSGRGLFFFPTGYSP